MKGAGLGAGLCPGRTDEGKSGTNTPCVYMGAFVPDFPSSALAAEGGTQPRGF